MRICETRLIPCPAVVPGWSELPCMWNQEQCDTWRQRIRGIPIQKADGTLIPITEDLLEGISREAEHLFFLADGSNLKKEDITIKMVLTRLNLL
jgi:hypothetical protein